MQRTILSHTHFAQDLIQMLASNRHLEANQGNLGAKQIFIDWEMAVDLGYNDIKSSLNFKIHSEFYRHMNFASTPKFKEHSLKASNRSFAGMLS